MSGGYSQIGGATGGYNNVDSVAVSSGISPDDIRITEQELNMGGNNGGGGSSMSSFGGSGNSFGGGGYSSSSGGRNDLLYDVDDAKKKKWLLYLLGVMAFFTLIRYTAESGEAQKMEQGIEHGVEDIESVFEKDKDDNSAAPKKISTVTQTSAGSASKSAAKSGGDGDGTTDELTVYHEEMLDANEQATVGAASRFRQAGMLDSKPSATLRQGCESTVMIVRNCEKSSDNMINGNYLHKHCNYVGFERAQYLTTLFGSLDKKEDDEEARRNRKLFAEDNDDDEIQVEKPGSTATASQAEVKSDDVDDEELLEEEEEVEEFVEEVVVAAEVAELVVKEELYKEEHAPKYPYPSYLYALHPHRPGQQYKDFSEVETLRPLSLKYNVTLNEDYTVSTLEHLTDEIFTNLKSGALCGRTALIAWDRETIPRLAQSLGCGPFDGCPALVDASVYDGLWQLKYVFDPVVNPKFVVGTDEEEANSKDRHYQGWELWGSVRHQGFDPLHYSASSGGYDPVSGVAVSSQWMNTEEENELEETGNSIFFGMVTLALLFGVYKKYLAEDNSSPRTSSSFV